MNRPLSTIQFEIKQIGEQAGVMAGWTARRIDPRDLARLIQSLAELVLSLDEAREQSREGVL